MAEEQTLRCNNIAELSPGAINSCRSEYHAAFNSMMMERMTTDINALKRQYSRIKKKQQQQLHQVYIRAGKGILPSVWTPSRSGQGPWMAPEFPSLWRIPHTSKVGDPFVT